MKNILAENMRRFRTKNLNEQLTPGLEDDPISDELPHGHDAPITDTSKISSLEDIKPGSVFGFKLPSNTGQFIISGKIKNTELLKRSKDGRVLFLVDAFQKGHGFGSKSYMVCWANHATGFNKPSWPKNIFAFFDTADGNAKLVREWYDNGGEFKVTPAPVLSNPMLGRLLDKNTPKPMQEPEFKI